MKSFWIVQSKGGINWEIRHQFWHTYLSSHAEAPSRAIYLTNWSVTHRLIPFLMPGTLRPVMYCFKNAWQKWSQFEAMQRCVDLLVISLWVECFLQRESWTSRLKTGYRDEHLWVKGKMLSKTAIPRLYFLNHTHILSFNNNLSYITIELHTFLMCFLASWPTIGIGIDHGMGNVRTWIIAEQTSKQNKAKQNKKAQLEGRNHPKPTPGHPADKSPVESTATAVAALRSWKEKGWTSGPRWHPNELQTWSTWLFQNPQKVI